MADYIIGGIIIIGVVLAVRSYFGRKYANEGCQGCSGCARAKECGKENIDKSGK